MILSHVRLQCRPEREFSMNTHIFFTFYIRAIDISGPSLLPLSKFSFFKIPRKTGRIIRDPDKSNILSGSVSLHRSWVGTGKHTTWATFYKLLFTLGTSLVVSSPWHHKVNVTVWRWFSMRAQTVAVSVVSYLDKPKRHLWINVIVCLDEPIQWICPYHRLTLVKEWNKIINHNWSKAEYRLGKC